MLAVGLVSFRLIAALFVISVLSLIYFGLRLPSVFNFTFSCCLVVIIPSGVVSNLVD
jgi:hypothetical protein